MKTLFIDTSSKQALIGISEGNHLLAAKRFLHENKLASLFLPNLESLLSASSLSLQAIQQVAVGVGPGSYTGTRVGVIMAKSVSFGLQIPIRGFCSLLLYLPNTRGTFRCFQWAKSGDAFAMIAEKTENAIIVQSTGKISKKEINTLPHFFMDIEVSDAMLPNLDNLPLLVSHPPEHAFEQKVELLYFSSIEKFPALR